MNDTQTEYDRIVIDCPRCHGTGGPAPIWDDELQRSITYVCSSCSGSGISRVWVKR